MEGEGGARVNVADDDSSADDADAGDDGDYYYYDDDDDDRQVPGKMRSCVLPERKTTEMISPTRCHGYSIESDASGFCRRTMENDSVFCLFHA